MFESLEVPSNMSKGSKRNDDDDAMSDLKICQNSAHFASNKSMSDLHKKQASEESLQFIDCKVVHEDFTTFRDDNQKSQVE